jgi:SAM-dependent methyltransferase
VLGDRKFDLILLQDVLEHLRAPGELLRECLGLLKANGRILVSLPNVANISVRLALLCGRFEYARRGILDETHVRFYTARSARRLLEEAGYEIVERRMTVIPVELALRQSPQSLAMRAANRILRVLTVFLPGLLGYQSVLLARPRAAAESSVRSASVAFRPAA